MKAEELIAHVADPLWREEILQAFRKFANILLQDESLTDEDRLIVMEQKSNEIRVEQERNYYKKHKEEEK